MKIIEKKSKKSTYILDLIIEKKDYVEKNEETLKAVTNDFDFNQDQDFESNEGYRSPGWERLKKKLLK